MNEMNYEEINYEEITARMKQIRKERKVTQKQIADESDCTVAFVSNVENNRTKLNLRLLSYYSKLCNVPMEAFFNKAPLDTLFPAGNGSALENEIAALDQKMLSAFHRYNMEERKKILAILELWRSN